MIHERGHVSQSVREVYQHNGDKYRVRGGKKTRSSPKCICGLMKGNRQSPFLLSPGYICTTASLWLVYSQSDILHIDCYTLTLV